MTYEMEKSKLALKVITLCLVFFDCSSAPNNLTNLNLHLLPSSIIPESYEVNLSPRLSNRTFTGSVLITGIADGSVNVIVLNSDGLNILSGVVYDMTLKEINITSIECSEEQMCSLELQEPLLPDVIYTVELDFSGTIREEHGIYADKYEDSNGTKHWVIMTEFQPVHARKAFPCFDDPSLKAQFLMRIARPQNMKVLSNMPLNHTSDPDPNEDFYVWDQFEQSPPMSTYLVAFIITDYVNVTDTNTNSNIWAPAEKVHAAKYTLDVGVNALRTCQKYFDVPYDFPKLDHVPVPSQVFSAMENWGMITYLMEVFFWEEGISTSEDKLWHTAVIMHEVSHQWFGNLVTLKWWSFTWLNEGFASFLNNMLVDQIEPSWRMLDIFAVISVQQIMAEDFNETSHPLVNTVVSPSQITSNFDGTTYDKGAAILHMVYHFLTPEVFQKGLNLYLINNAYSNVEDEDLWVSLEANANTGLDYNLQEIMHNWTYEVGYPLINVQRTSNKSVILTQVKYEKTYSDKTASWWIPLTYTTSNELNFNSTETKEWFDPRTEEHVLKIELEHQEWIILNIRQNGYYRVNYDIWSWQLLIQYLKTSDISDIHPVNRAMLINDAFSLAQSADLNYDVPLNLSTYLYRETDYIPWVSAIRVFNDLRSKFYGTKENHLLQKYLLDLVENVYSNLSLNSEDGDMITKLNRMQIIDFACNIGNKHCETESVKLVYLLMSGVHIELPVDLKATILCTAVRMGHVETWNFVEKLYIKSKDKVQRKHLITALGCSTKSEIILRLLKDTLISDSDIRDEDAFAILQSISLQRYNSRLLLNFISENIHPLLTKFDSKIFGLLTTISQVKMDEEDQMKVLEVFDILRDYMPEIKLNSLKENSDWNERYFDRVVEWLSRAQTTKESTTVNLNNESEETVKTTSTPLDLRTVAPQRKETTTRKNFGNRKTAANILLLISTVMQFFLL